ncbi:hypothetical protein SynRS9915_01822 [Synechococcus sp. RS9915]|nr:hypothetical protein SynRS9915_01822 [Synechococcus sp. RS9915]
MSWSQNKAPNNTFVPTASALRKIPALIAAKTCDMTSRNTVTSRRRPVAKAG